METSDLAYLFLLGAIKYPLFPWQALFHNPKISTQVDVLNL